MVHIRREKLQTNKQEREAFCNSPPGWSTFLLRLRTYFTLHGQTVRVRSKSSPSGMPRTLDFGKQEDNRFSEILKLPRVHKRVHS